MNKFNTIERLHNGDLKRELERILNYDLPISISMEYDDNLDYPYIIGVEDNSYFYANENEQKSDYLNLYSLLKPNGYDFQQRSVDFFTLYTIEEINNYLGIDISETDTIDIVASKIEERYSIFYISNNDTDVLEAIADEKDIHKQLDAEELCILPQCIFVSIY